MASVIESMLSKYNCKNVSSTRPYFMVAPHSVFFMTLCGTYLKIRV